MDPTVRFTLFTEGARRGRTANAVTGGPDIRLRGGRILVGDGTAARSDAAVDITDGRITAIGPVGDDAVEAVVDLDVTGFTVMPGLIDAHCHITFGEPASNDELFFHRDQSTAALLAAFNVQKLLLAGVTGFLDADCLWNLGPALRDAIDAGIVVGPRMSAGMNALLTAAGGTAGRLIPDRGRAGYAHVVRNRDEMVQTTREQIKYGADWIKIHVTGAIPRHSGEITVWTVDELRAVTETAHELDTPVLAHCRNAESTARAASAGVDLILHASHMDDAALEAVIAAGSAIAPTFTFLANLAEHGAKVGAMTSQVDVFRGEIEATAAMMRTAHEHGVRLLCGSESGFSLTPYGHWHGREAELFVDEVGLTPLEAITCATSNGAFALRMTPDEVGELRVGAVADVLVIDGDPTTDIGLLNDRSALRHVISGGRAVDLDVPWPERAALPGEKVGLWSRDLLTRDRAGA